MKTTSARSLTGAAAAAALSLGVAACGARPPVAPPAAVIALTPDAPPALPFEPPYAGAESMNTEYYLGSAAQEATRFRQFAEQIRLIQARQTASRDQPVQRGFHAKSHGCAYGRLELDPDRDPRLRHGVFADGKGPWPLWARFSNGVGWQQADDELDARGLALKLMGVPGPKRLPDETGTQDFLLTNSPTPVGANAEEFMRFAHANAKGTVPGLGFAVGHLGTAAPALLRTNAIDSMVNAQYWSGGALHLGAHQAVKLSARPCPGVAPRTPDRGNPDYLRADLAAAAAEPGGLCFELLVQLQVDPERTPIENAAVEWTDEVSPPLRVGRLVFPTQDLSDPRRAPFCRQLSFNPWHGVAAHQPMGHINRARRFVYDASRDRRQGGLEPKDFAGFDVPVVPEPAVAPASAPESAPESAPAAAPEG